MMAGMTMVHQFQPTAALTRPKPDRIGFDACLLARFVPRVVPALGPL
jgi:hypothetical protein